MVTKVIGSIIQSGKKFLQVSDAKPATTLNEQSKNVVNDYEFAEGIEPSTLITSSSEKKRTGKGSRLPNPLHEYALYNYLFSLSVLDDESYVNARYKTSGDNGPYIARSASRDPDNRIPTIHGKFEYFIDSVKINHIAGFEKSTGNTNAMGLTFKVIEPYSMGLFFQVLQAGCLSKGHKNYLDAPYLLTIEFTGHIDADKQMVKVPRTTKHIPIKFRLMNMRVTGQGSEYDISAYPVNEQAFEKSKIIINSSLSLKGSTVREMLKIDPDKSLELVLNKRSKEQKADKTINQEDEYEIVFPDSDDIASSSMGFDLYRKNDTPFGEDNLTYENGIYKRGNLSIDPSVSEFRWPQGVDIVNIINQVILMSEYGRKALASVSSDGFVNWWRVEPELKFISSDANLNKTGTKPKKYIYRIVKYRVDSSHFLPPNDRRKGTEADKKAVAKEYNYIYSGKNIDILDFDIEFRAGFYTAISADGNKNNSEKILNSFDSAGLRNQQERRTRIQASEGSSVTNNREFPTAQQPSLLSTSNSDSGGGSYETNASLAAKQFHDAITAGVDMVGLNLTILGDPYYISDSGTGNYHSPNKGGYVNADDSMPWDTREIHILINFRTPVDFNTETGLYDFGNTTLASQFSGLYRLTRGESYFQRGKFTQVLRLLRLRNQDSAEGDGQLAVQPIFTLESLIGTFGLGGP
jgi:hypothetical protein